MSTDLSVQQYRSEMDELDTNRAALGNTPFSASLVTYRTEPSVLDQALRSIQDSKCLVETYVVDNSPSDELRSVVSSCNAIYVHSGDNLGYGRGHNFALSMIGNSSKYHLILNPDISFGPSVLGELLGFLEVNPEIGWVMPSVFYPDGTPQNLCKRLPTPWDLFRRRLSHAGPFRLFNASQSRYECADIDLSIPRSIPCLSGCFALIRTELLRQVGGFDARFFMYLEDTDLVRRIGERALTVYYPHVHVHHVHGRGSYKSMKLLRHHLVSAARYFSKWGWFNDPRRDAVNAALASDEPRLVITEIADCATN